MLYFDGVALKKREMLFKEKYTFLAEYTSIRYI